MFSLGIKNFQDIVDGGPTHRAGLAEQTTIFASNHVATGNIDDTSLGIHANDTLVGVVVRIYSLFHHRCGVVITLVRFGYLFVLLPDEYKSINANNGDK